LSDDPDSSSKGHLGEARRAVRFSILAITGVFLLKLAVGLFSGSIALVADAFNSLADTTLLIIIYLALRILEKKPDRHFRYGYYKLEDLLSLMMSFAFVGVAFMVIYDGLRAILFGFEGSTHYIEAAVTEIAVAAILFAVSWKQYKAAERANITSLALSARDMRIDVISAIFVALSIILNKTLRFPLEGYAAMIIGILIIQNAFRGITTAGRNLLDAWNRPEITRRIEEIINETGSLKVGEIRLRRAGPIIFGEITVYAHEDLRLEEIDDILEIVEKKIYEEIPDIKEIVFEVEPLQTNYQVIGVPAVDTPDGRTVLASELSQARKIVIYHFYPNSGVLIKRGEVPVERNGSGNGTNRRNGEREIVICRQLKRLMVDIVVVKYISEIAYEILKGYGVEVYIAETDEIHEVLQAIKTKHLNMLSDYSDLERKYTMREHSETESSELEYPTISAEIINRIIAPKNTNDEDINPSKSRNK